MKQDDINLVVGALDSLGVALADHNHQWTEGERCIYEKAVEILSQRHGEDAELTHVENYVRELRRCIRDCVRQMQDGARDHDLEIRAIELSEKPIKRGDSATPKDSASEEECPKCHYVYTAASCPLCAAMQHPGVREVEELDSASKAAGQDEVLAALKELFALVESGVLVRDISHDTDPKWYLKAIELTSVLAAAKSAIANATLPPET